MKKIRDFVAANDNDFYPTIASRRDLADFVQSVYEAKGKYVICFDGDKIAGLTSVYLNHPQFITYYHYIAIDKEYRGMGISTTLYNYVHKICGENGVQRAIVKTWSTNRVSQAMFKKHGFFHLYTAEDDRSKGVHTYFLAKSFSQQLFDHPVKRIGITGMGHNNALGNFVKTVCSIPKINTADQPPLPFAAINGRPNEIMDSLAATDISHILALDSSMGTWGETFKMRTGIEIIDLPGIIKRMVGERKKRWILIGEGCNPKADLGIANLLYPQEKEQKRIDEIIDEIRTGKVSPAYHKHEIAAITVLNDCEGVLLGVPELHTMFGFDKAYNGVELFDPWMELAIIIQYNRMNFKTQVTDTADNSMPSR